MQTDNSFGYFNKKSFMKIFAITLLSFMVLLAGCSANKKQFEDLNEIGKEYQLRNTWVLAELDGKPASLEEFQNELPWMELKVDATVFNGYAGCNVMSGRLLATSSTIKFENIITTMMACQGGGEQKFLRAIESADSWDVKNGKLYLKSGEIVVAEFIVKKD